MAVSEQSFQRELLKEIRLLDGWHAFKITSMFIGGIPDLYIKRLNHPALWVELKFLKNTKNMPRDGVPIELTPLQRHFIYREQQAGGYAGWIVCLADRNHWRVYTGNHHLTVIVKYNDHAQLRLKGQKWNLDLILRRVEYGY